MLLKEALLPNEQAVRATETATVKRNTNTGKGKTDEANPLLPIQTS